MGEVTLIPVGAKGASHTMAWDDTAELEPGRWWARLRSAGFERRWYGDPNAETADTRGPAVLRERCVSAFIVVAAGPAPRGTCAARPILTADAGALLRNSEAVRPDSIMVRARRPTQVVIEMDRVKLGGRHGNLVRSDVPEQAFLRLRNHRRSRSGSSIRSASPEVIREPQKILEADKAVFREITLSPCLADFDKIGAENQEVLEVHVNVAIRIAPPGHWKRDCEIATGQAIAIAIQRISGFVADSRGT